MSKIEIEEYILSRKEFEAVRWCVDNVEYRIGSDKDADEEFVKEVKDIYNKMHDYDLWKERRSQAKSNTIKEIEKIVDELKFKEYDEEGFPFVVGVNDLYKKLKELGEI